MLTLTSTVYRLNLLGYYDPNSMFSGSYGHCYPPLALLTQPSLHTGSDGVSGNRELGWGQPFYGTTSGNQDSHNNTTEMALPEEANHGD